MIPQRERYMLLISVTASDGVCHSGFQAEYEKKMLVI